MAGLFHDKKEHSDWFLGRSEFYNPWSVFTHVNWSSKTIGKI